VKQFKASNPEIKFAAATQPEFDRERERAPYRINAPGTQYPAPSNPLARMGQFTPRRWK
jgi:hypothetical protein